ncbi:MAG: nucleotidyl transferase AbiEii/AbiGii toxin family protein [Oscillospiraceae bacterium]|nr:nucleotidyl transferase AbiEii/AbiGii toxin family protein [Oscillospiraceae bacterium]
MNDNEKLMYQVMGQISNSNAPIVFIGGLITKLILKESGYTNIERATRDIDSNWIGKPPSMSDMVDIINNSLGNLKDLIYAVPEREYSQDSSARLLLLKKNTDDLFFSIDINVKPVIGNKIYYFGETSIRGVLPNEIITDKVSALSAHKVFRRTKDMIDIYALTHCVEIKTTDIFSICDKKGITIKPFIEYHMRVSDVKHAYEKLRGLIGKPPFEIVYNYIDTFVRPFAEQNKANQLWNPDMISWIS